MVAFQQGRLLTFRRCVQVDKWADMQIAIKASAAHTVSFLSRVGMLIGAYVAFGALLLVSRLVRAK